MRLLVSLEISGAAFCVGEPCKALLSSTTAGQLLEGWIISFSPDAVCCPAY